MDSVLEVLYPKLFLFVLGFGSFVSTCLLHLLRYFTRFTRKSGSLKGISNDLMVPLTESMEEEEEENQDFFEFSSEEDNRVDEKEVKKDDEIEAHEFSFSFKFPTFEEFSKNPKNFPEVLLEESKADTNSSGGLVSNESWVLDFAECVNESHDDKKEDGFEDKKCVVEHLMVDSSNLKNLVEIDEKDEVFTFEKEITQKDSAESVYLSSYPNIVLSKDGFLSNEIKIAEMEGKDEKFDTFGDESVFSSPNSNSDSSGSNNLSSPIFSSHHGDGFLSDADFEVEFDEKEDSNRTQFDFLIEKDFGSKSRSASDATNKLESLWEHQELIDQLQMEIKKVKAIGLPTIFEESESPPKIMEDLKPWKIEEVYQNSGGKMSEVHKFYKSYRERMRKFDIFSYQKMYTIGFLQLKDSSSMPKSSIPEISTLFGQTLTTNKGKKHENDPTTKFIKELQSDLEVVYVGQMCLSWEILHWQYEKALDIWESDPRGTRRFNDIAGEFQQFQVLMQRFIEDEPFQGPRIQNYVKNRCVFRNLLQVPVIRDDHMKNKKARSDEVVYDITSDVLVEILEESIP